MTNKILHYLLGGLAVVAGDTTGQLEIAGEPGMAISLYRAGNPIDLAEKLDSLLRDRERFLQAKSEALRVAEKTFCWERQTPKLLQSVEVALSARPVQS